MVQYSVPYVPKNSRVLCTLYSLKMRVHLQILRVQEIKQNSLQSEMQICIHTHACDILHTSSKKPGFFRLLNFFF